MLYRAAKARPTRGYRSACIDIACNLRSLTECPATVFVGSRAFVPLDVVLAMVNATAAAATSSATGSSVAAASTTTTAAAAAAAAAAALAPATYTTKSTATKSTTAPGPNSPAYDVVPVTAMRRVIAERLTLSKTTVPHYGVTAALRVDRLLHLRKLLNEKNSDSKLSVTDFIVKAAALAMRAAPHVNASWQGDTIRVFRDVDVCVAVATPTGLLTPVVRGAQARGLASISRESKDLAARAKRGALAPAELTGTFTISNLGMYGCVDSFGAIINPPQAAILAVAGVEEIVVRGEEPGAYETAQQMRVTLSCDHRVVDGAVAAEWLREFKRVIEEPLNLMM